jgi:hypothetical protein
MSEKSEKPAKHQWQMQRSRVRWWMWVLPVIAIAGLFAWPKAKAATKRWSAGRHLRRAEESILQKDFKRAVLDVRSAIEAGGMNAKAARTMAEALEGAGAFANAAAWRSQFEGIQPGDVANTVAWASDSLKAGDVPTASRLLSALQPQPANDVEYHATAAALAEATHDTAGTELHWAEALRLRPDDEHYKMRLAVLRLTAKEIAKHDDAVTALRELSTRPATCLSALRALLTDAVHFTDWQSAMTHADALVAAPGSNFADKLARLEMLRTMKADAATSYLSELRNVALGNPADLYLMLMWMEQHHLALMASEWVRSLPPEQVDVPLVSVAAATVFARSAEWQRLREFLEGHAWGEWEYVRHAFLSRTLEKLGDEDDAATQEWAEAVSVARSRADAIPRLERIVRLAIGWGWEQRAQEVMWGMVNAPLCPPWIPEALRQIAEESAHAGQLQKLAALRLRADPKSAVLRNAFAFYSLLARSDSGDPHREAERLFAEHPGDTAIAITRALSLFQQGRTDDALAVTSALPAAELQKPHPAFYQALLFTAKGESEKAASFLAAAGSRKMFVEEKALLERAKLNADKSAREQDVAEALKAARAAKAARDAEAEKDIKAARIARSQVASSDDANLAALMQARRAAKAAEDAEKEKAVQAARAARERDKAVKEAVGANPSAAR